MEVVTSTTLVPSLNTILVPLSVVEKVVPVPDTVLNCTVKDPDVPFKRVYVFSIESGMVTT